MVDAKASPLVDLSASEPLFYITKILLFLFINSILCH